MNNTRRLVCLAIAPIVGIGMCCCALAQSGGAYAAGINYPAGPPTPPNDNGDAIGGISPMDIHYGDFNGDGKQDVLVGATCSYTDVAGCPESNSAVVVYLGNGDGTFQAPLISGGIPQTPRSTQVGDFNGDGVLDVAVAADCLLSGCSSGSITILLGNGDGTFTEKSQYSLNGVVGEAGTLAVGDFNGDNALDVAVGIECYNGGCSSGSVSIFLGNGDGTLGTPTPYTTVGNIALYPVVGDFNNDGNLDVIAGSGYAPGDNTHSSLTVLLGNGKGVFSESVTPLSFSRLSGLAPADFNSDGNLDLAISTTIAVVQILDGNGKGAFQSPVSVVSSLGYGYTDRAAIAIADMNGDGFPDLMVSGTDADNFNNGVQIFLNNGGGSFTAGNSYGLGGSELAPFVAGDFNRDGKVDIVMASTISEVGNNSEGTISVLLGNGDGSMQGARVITTTQNLQSNSAITADLNGDGIPDLIQTVLNYGGEGAVFVSMGLGNDTYGPPTAVSTGSPNSFWVLAADFNRDGKLDLAVANECSDETCTQGGVAILLGNGDGTFQSPTIYSAGAQYSLSIVSGDFNGDGKLDVAVMNQSASIGILLGNGDGTLQTAVVTDTSSGVSSNYSMAPGDFNADGKTDIALVSQAPTLGTGVVRIYLSGDGGTLTQSGSAVSTGGTAGPSNGMSIAVGDINGDGIPDLVVSNSCDLNGDSSCGYGSISAFIGGGGGSFGAGITQTVPDGNFYSLLLTDVNGDGILDAIATNSTGVAVFLGKGTGVFKAPTVYAGVATGGENVQLAMDDLDIIQPGLSNGVTAILVNRAGSYLVSKSSSIYSYPSHSIPLTSSATASYLTGITPTGTISYYEGATLLASAPLKDGTASVDVSGLSLGEHTIVPYYSGDSNFSAYYGTPILHLVIPYPTETSITSPPITYGAYGKVTINVTSTAGTVTGYVSLTVDSGTPLIRSLTNGEATIYLPGLTGGSHTLTASYAAQGIFGKSSATGTLQVNPAQPTVTFTGAPVSAAYGATFTVTATTNASTTAVITASGSCSVAGDTAVISVGSGTCYLKATWAADENYLSATARQSTTATQATPTINWAAPAPITYGTALSKTQLDATATFAGSPIGGTYVYSPAAGTVLTVGSQTLSVTFTPTKTADYTTATGNVMLQVKQGTPTITWSKPADITYGTALSSTQLDATASVRGAFVYSPAAGAVLNAGAHALSVTFTPADTTDYTTATREVGITVEMAGTTTTITSNKPNPSLVNQAVTVRFTVTSSAGPPGGSVSVNASTGESCSGTISAGSCSLTFATTGSRTITAGYQGGYNFVGSQSAGVTQNVEQ